MNSELSKALLAWNQVFDGRIDGDILSFNNEKGKGKVIAYDFDDNLQALQFKFKLNTPLTCSGKKMNEINEYVPIFFGEPVEQSLEIEQQLEKGEGFSKEDFSINSQGAFATNTKDTINWEFSDARELTFLSIRLKKEHFIKLIQRSERLIQLFDFDDSFYIFEEFDPIMFGMFNRSFALLEDETLIYKKELVEACVRHLFATFFTKVSEREELLASNKYPVNTKAVFIARTILKNQLDKPIHIEDLSRECGLSGSRLRALFKQVFGTTIHQYHQDVRLDKARTYLTQGEKSMSMIAMDLGFSSASHFSAVFKKQYHMTPREFKEDLKQRKF
ncbi:helix-turn-helix transcriptional regulator [Flammeovirga agarivorans]|uniref:Helix-turn-helix transcriptional regulator n=1 Tax=Flammeovirga agarivorans TaxID=2726742 RepID=A0A7X8XZ28_9BACT|nr:helix-turn-helix domain-containing protein [Flammeovirga agarivorans]NLR94683.1 helix-turn-helix transcriptional regulator [Flammeovirga agarivorans]